MIIETMRQCSNCEQVYSRTLQHCPNCGLNSIQSHMVRVGKATGETK